MSSVNFLTTALACFLTEFYRNLAKTKKIIGGLKFNFTWFFFKSIIFKEPTRSHIKLCMIAKERRKKNQRGDQFGANSFFCFLFVVVNFKTQRTTIWTKTENTQKPFTQSWNFKQRAKQIKGRFPKTINNHSKKFQVQLSNEKYLV